ncbi:hypothetical protein C8F04DRAFT_1406131 [Mycena alexandri]|uniref:Uncharacterized protein n=1 Tax=Mycena alexandri TaxID=1745969 RepID=A0AAD6RY50_9AGAR|nr:hypothetical protein C8F04DRAFT_1406131 [Mycena alexandri]
MAARDAGSAKEWLLTSGLLMRVGVTPLANLDYLPTCTGVCNQLKMHDSIVPWPVRLVLNETEEPEAVAERVPTLGVVEYVILRVPCPSPHSFKRKTIAGLFRSQYGHAQLCPLSPLTFCSGITRPHLDDADHRLCAVYVWNGRLHLRARAHSDLDLGLNNQTTRTTTNSSVSLASSAGDASDNEDDDDDVTTLVLRAARNTPSTTCSLANLSSQPRFISTLERSISFMTSPEIYILFSIQITYIWIQSCPYTLLVVPISNVPLCCYLSPPKLPSAHIDNVFGTLIPSGLLDGLLGRILGGLLEGGLGDLLGRLGGNGGLLGGLLLSDLLGGLLGLGWWSLGLLGGGNGGLLGGLLGGGNGGLLVSITGLLNFFPGLSSSCGTDLGELLEIIQAWRCH